MISLRVSIIFLSPFFLSFIPLSGRERFVSEVCEMHTQHNTLQTTCNVLKREIPTLMQAKFDLSEYCFLFQDAKITYIFASDFFPSNKFT